MALSAQTTHHSNALFQDKQNEMVPDTQVSYLVDWSHRWHFQQHKQAISYHRSMKYIT